MPRGWALLLLSLLGACSRQVLVGTLGCATVSDCQPPASICGPDARCVPGCTTSPSGCPGGASCDPQSGECAGGPFGSSCTDDLACDPPDIVCRASTHTCVAGCTLSGSCDDGTICQAQSGRCCDLSVASCILEPVPSSPCLGDKTCPQPQICVNGTCTARCDVTGCVAPLACGPATGHCALPTCTRDVDCDASSFCNAAGQCTLLPGPTPGPCAGGHVLAFSCASEDSTAELTSCSIPAGPAACPYCLDGACFALGVCNDSDDCHHDATCEQGLCRGVASACSTTVAVADVIAGHFGVGKEVCVEGRVKSVRSGYDGMIELKLDAGSFIFADVPPAYHKAGVALPEVGQTRRVHGTVRWDAGHEDWEISPIDWISP